MKSKKSVLSRRSNAKPFDLSMVNLATLAGLPISRRRSKSCDGGHVVTGVTINMADFEGGISDLLRSIRQS